jgi:hypothetical protein
VVERVMSTRSSWLQPARRVSAAIGKAPDRASVRMARGLAIRVRRRLARTGARARMDRAPPDERVPPTHLPVRRLVRNVRFR